MRMISWTKTLFAGALLIAGLGTGCGAKEYFNCRSLCEKHMMCSDTNYNVQNCTDSCSTNANASTEYARKVDTCQECVKSLSCTDYKVAACLPNCPNLPN